MLAKGGKIIKNYFLMNTLQQALFKQKPSRNSGGGVNTALGISGKYTAPRKYSTGGARKIVPVPPDNAQNFPLQEIILGCSSRLLYFFPKTPFKEGCHHICTYVRTYVVHSCMCLISLPAGLPSSIHFKMQAALNVSHTSEPGNQRSPW